MWTPHFWWGATVLYAYDYEDFFFFPNFQHAWGPILKSSKVELPGELSPFTDNRRLEVKNEQTQNTVIISQHNVIANVKILDNF